MSPPMRRRTWVGMMVKWVVLVKARLKWMPEPNMRQKRKDFSTKAPMTDNQTSAYLSQQSSSAYPGPAAPGKKVMIETKLVSITANKRKIIYCCWSFRWQSCLCSTHQVVVREIQLHIRWKTISKKYHRHWWIQTIDSVASWLPVSTCHFTNCPTLNES